jgi:hypothetical protein
MSCEYTSEFAYLLHGTVSFLRSEPILRIFSEFYGTREFINA